MGRHSRANSNQGNNDNQNTGDAGGNGGGNQGGNQGGGNQGGGQGTAPVRISLQPARPVQQRPVMEDIRNDSTNIQQIPGTGEIVLELKAPGISEVLLNEENLRAIRDRLAQEVPEGNSPSAVFNRTASERDDGAISARFSDEPRARTLTLTPQDRTEFVEWADGLLAEWPNFQSKFDELARQQREAEAAAAAATAGNRAGGTGGVKLGGNAQ